jgi:hypothetical protein
MAGFSAGVSGKMFSGSETQALAAQRRKQPKPTATTDRIVAIVRPTRKLDATKTVRDST